MKMNILVTLNSGYIQPLTVMLNSLLSSNSNRDFRVFVAHSSLTRRIFAISRSMCRWIDVSL